MTSIDPNGDGPLSPADLPNDVLVVEDDPLIALDTDETIRSFGVASVRTVSNASAALQAITERTPEFVLLNIGLFKEKSDIVADQLETLKIPFAFVTGYSGTSHIPAKFASRAVLLKPYLRDTLLDVLRKWRASGS